jgi:hypothetical protein
VHIVEMANHSKVLHQIMAENRLLTLFTIAQELVVKHCYNLHHVLFI